MQIQFLPQRAILNALLVLATKIERVGGPLELIGPVDPPFRIMALLNLLEPL